MAYSEPLEQIKDNTTAARPWGVRGPGALWISPRYDDLEHIETMRSAMVRRTLSNFLFLGVFAFAVLTLLVWIGSRNDQFTLKMLAVGAFGALGAVIYRALLPKVEHAPLPSDFSYVVTLLDRASSRAHEGTLYEDLARQAHQSVLGLHSGGKTSRDDEVEQVEQHLRRMLNAT